MDRLNNVTARARQARICLHSKIEVEVFVESSQCLDDVFL